MLSGLLNFLCLFLGVFQPAECGLENLAKQIEALADAEIFQEAFEEIQAGKNRLMKSVYAQQLCFYLEECTKVTQGVS